MDSIKIFVISLLCIPIPIWGQDANDIIRHYFDTVSNGDVNNWEKIKSAYIESISYYSEQDFAQKTPDLRARSLTVHKFYQVWPDKSRRDIFEDSILVSSFYHVGKQHFFIMGNMQPMPLSSGPYEPYFQFDPIIIRNVMKKTKGATLTSISELDGSNYYVIRVINTGLIWHLYFSMETFLLEYWNNSPDGDTSILTRVFNYKKFRDYLIPMSEIKKRNGVVFFGSDVQKLDLNIEIDPEKFNYKVK